MIGITIVMIVMMVVINDGCNDCQLQGLRCDRSLESWFIQYIYIICGGSSQYLAYFRLVNYSNLPSRIGGNYDLVISTVSNNVFFQSYQMTG